MGEDLRGHIEHKVLKSVQYRYLNDKGIAVLDPLTEYKKKLQHEKELGYKRFLETVLSKEIKDLEKSIQELPPDEA